jgi:hypothetical protein
MTRLSAPPHDRPHRPIGAECPCLSRRAGPTRLGGRRSVVLVLACVTWPVALPGQDADPRGRPAAPPDAEAVLAGRGLRRVANLYLLEPAETAFRLAADQNRDAVARLQAEAGTILQGQQRGELRWVRITRQIQDLEFQLDERIRDAQRQAERNRAPSSPFDGINQQIRDLRDLIGRLRTDAGALASEQRQRARRLEDLRVEIAGREDEVRRRAEELAALYRRLAGDPEVVRALKELNRPAGPWVMIGPASEYEANVVKFARLVLADAGLRLDAKRSQLSLAAAEAEAGNLGHRLWVLRRDLPKGPAGVGYRAQMAELVERLRRRIEEIQQSYATLLGDPLILKAIAKCGQSLGKPLRVTPSPDFDKEVKRLPEFEAALRPES